MQPRDDLESIGLDPARRAAFGPMLAEGERLARVVAQHRNGYRVDDGAGERAVGAPASMTRPGGDPLNKPAVGDWVIVDAETVPAIRALLPRAGALMRTAAGERGLTQIIAANVDRVLVVTGLDADFNPRRLERYLALVSASGALPAVILTKIDCSAHAAVRVIETEVQVGAAVPVFAVNARELVTASRLAPLFPPGSTAVLVGSSGAGKSTLTNTLLGIDRQATAAVRAHDARGRHTTTHRALLRLPGGACLIDTPGMRELKLTGDESLEGAVFDDIEGLAGQCRFRDCRHGNEPGCAVRAALESGALDRARFTNWLKLRDEREAALAATAARARRTDPRPQRRAR